MTDCSSGGQGNPSRQIRVLVKPDLPIRSQMEGRGKNTHFSKSFPSNCKLKFRFFCQLRIKEHKKVEKSSLSTILFVLYNCMTLSYPFLFCLYPLIRSAPEPFTDLSNLLFYKTPHPLITYGW